MKFAPTNDYNSIWKLRHDMPLLDINPNIDDVDVPFCCERSLDTHSEICTYKKLKFYLEIRI